MDDEIWMIYSPSEQAWWDNDSGWVALAFATEFTEDESQRLNLPDGPDCLWVRIA